MKAGFERQKSLGPTSDESAVPPHRRFTAKRDIVGEPVYVSYLRSQTRDMRLQNVYSRVLLRGEIHELVTTDEQTQVGGVVHGVAYIGFFEVAQGGSLRVGDTLRVNGRPVGRLAGFDITHFPNHFNLVLQCERAVTGRDLGLSLDDEIRFTAE